MTTKTMEAHRKEAQAKVHDAQTALHDAKNAAWIAATGLAKMFDPYGDQGIKASAVSEANRTFDAVQRATQELEHARNWLAQVSSLADRMALDA